MASSVGFHMIISPPARQVFFAQKVFDVLLASTAICDACTHGDVCELPVKEKF